MAYTNHGVPSQEITLKRLYSSILFYKGRGISSASEALISMEFVKHEKVKFRRETRKLKKQRTVEAVAAGPWRGTASLQRSFIVSSERNTPAQRCQVPGTPTNVDLIVQMRVQEEDTNIITSGLRPEHKED